MKAKSTKQASAVTRKALSIYAGQKADYQKMLKAKCRQGKKPPTAAKEASQTYRALYGATPAARWRRALRAARMDKAASGGATLSVATRPARKKKGGRR